MRLDFNQLNDSQKENFNLALNAYKNGLEISSPKPPILYVELTQNCISRCNFCKPKWENNPSFDMSDKLFDLILSEYITFASMVDLRGWGESLMLPDFSKKLTQVRKLGPKIRIATTLGCGSKDTLDSLIDNDVYISVSLDAIDKQLYESIRQGISFDVMMRNLDYITNNLGKKGTLDENLRLSMTLHRDNIQEAEKMVNFADSKGISHLRIVPVQSYPNNPLLLKYLKSETIKTLRKVANLANEKGISLQLGFAPFEEFILSGKTYDPCCHPWMYAFIGYDGDIRPCEHMLGNSDMNLSVGNISSTPDWWNGLEMREFRLSHIKDRLNQTPGKCQKCYTLGRYADHEPDIYSGFEKWNFDANQIIGVCNTKLGK
jgi:radical SAM protein with 4Fe4S-binding SPASM domain